MLDNVRQRNIQSNGMETLDIARFRKVLITTHFNAIFVSVKRGILKRRVSVNSEVVLMRATQRNAQFPTRNAQLSQDVSMLCVTVLSIVSWDEDDDIMNSCGARVCVE